MNSDYGSCLDWSPRICQAVADLDNRSPKLLSRFKYEPADMNRSASEHQLGEYREQVEIRRYDYLWKDRSFIA